MKRIIAFLISLIMVFVISSVAFASDKDLPRWAPKYNADTFVVKVDENVMWYCCETQVQLDLWEVLGYYPEVNRYPEDGVIVFKLLNTKVQINDCIVDSRNESLMLVPDFVLPKDIIEINDLNLLFPSKENEGDQDYFNIKAMELNGAKIRETVDNDKSLSVTVMASGEYKYCSTSEYYEEDGEYYIAPRAFRQMYYQIYHGRN